MYKFLVSFILFTLISSCSTPEVSFYNQTSEVIGLDGTFCACCGDVILEIEGSTDEFRAKEFTSDFQELLDNEPLPFTIDLNISVLDTCNSYVFLRIEEFQLAE